MLNVYTPFSRSRSITPFVPAAFDAALTTLALASGTTNDLPLLNRTVFFAALCFIAIETCAYRQIRHYAMMPQVVGTCSLSENTILRTAYYY